MNTSAHNYLEKNRKPRVHIKYEIETEQGIEEKELPFVVGVIGDFTADNSKNLASLKEREFIPIDRDNFDEIMTELNPCLNLSVNNTLNEDDSSVLSLHLSFNSLSDFEPDQLVQQVEPLYKLKQARDRLRSLLNKAECSEILEQSLAAILADHDQLKQLAHELKTKMPAQPEINPHE